MKSVIALFCVIWCSLSVAKKSNNKGKKRALDWKDDKGANNKLYKGLIIQAYQTEDGGEPTIALGSERDGFNQVYCLNLYGVFESEDYDVTTGEYTVVPDSAANFTDCTLNEVSTAQFEVICDVNLAILNLSFAFTTDSKGDNGLEYTIKLEDYVLPTNATKLVIVQSLQDCSEDYQIDESEESEESEGRPDGGHDDGPKPKGKTEGGGPPKSGSEEKPEREPRDSVEPTDEPRRRLLEYESMESTQSGSMEETEVTEPGQTDSSDDDERNDRKDHKGDPSESDSREVDVGFSRFVSSGQAQDQCDDMVTDIDSGLVVQSALGQVHLVFDYFECDLILDPFIGLDSSQYEEIFGTTAIPSDTETDTDSDPQSDPSSDHDHDHDVDDESAAHSAGFMMSFVVSVITMVYQLSN